MLVPALVLAFSGLRLPADIFTVSSDERAAAPAPPRPPRTDEFDRRFSLEVRLGVAAPTGIVGVAAELSFVPQLGVGCGLGSNLVGPEYACWLRTRGILGRYRNRAVTISSGLSTAPFKQTESPHFFDDQSPAPFERDYKHAYWVNTDVGYESRSYGLVFRVFGGVAALLNPDDGVLPAWLSDSRSDVSCDVLHTARRI
jgi:hypothetical protein